MSTNPVPELKARVRTDLASAMRGGRPDEVRVLRTILAAVDDAEAVPAGAMHEKYRVKQFGDPSAEVPRRLLSPADVDALLLAEISAREAAASECLNRNATAHAESLRSEIAIVRRYLG
jgi:uncharacterized protein YqeY